MKTKGKTMKDILYKMLFLAVSVAASVTVIMFALHQWTISTGGVI